MNFTSENKTFSNKEWQIFQFVANHKDEVCSMPIRELAKINATSTSTILRFCKKFDCEGFSEFKFKLKKELLQQDKRKHLFKQDKKALHYFFDRMEEIVYQSELIEIARKIRKAKFLILSGDYESKLTLAYAQQKFALLDKVVITINVGENSNKSIWKTLNEEALLLVFSNSGTDTFIENLITTCTKAKIPTISLTNRSTSSIAKMVNQNFSYYYSDNQTSSSLSSQIPSIYLIELLVDMLDDF